MSKRREPEAVSVAEGGVLVKHTHDLELAGRLASELLTAEYERPCVAVGARKIWCRITHCLPNSNGSRYEGWEWVYHRVDGPGRGVFPAVEFTS